MTAVGRRKDRVVLVAPQNDDTMLLAGLFATAGFALSTVFDLETVLAMCKLSLPDGIVIDLDTPAIDGALLAARLRGMNGADSLTLVAIDSTSATRVPHETLHAAGIDTVVGRPATVTKLIDALSASARGRRVL
jgi:CheY-like chemotaxis protein